MKEAELIKFINEECLEASNDGTEAILWIYHFNIEFFVELMKVSNYLDYSVTMVNLQDDCIAIKINDMCEYFDIDVDKVIEVSN